MRVANDTAPRCPECSGILTYIKEVPLEASAQGKTFVVPLPSDIYRCPEHGLWRICISGSVEPYLEQHEDNR